MFNLGYNCFNSHFYLLDSKVSSDSLCTTMFSISHCKLFLFSSHSMPLPDLSIPLPLQWEQNSLPAIFP